jgi:hypothetical protein
MYDMVDWTTLDADLRATSHMASEREGGYVLGTVVTRDRITYLKTPNGDTWDVNLIDDVGIWAWRTETAWGQPGSFVQFRHVGQVLHAPRLARGGFPGMRWINCDSAFAGHIGCAEPRQYGYLGYIIHELYGPYDYEPGFGDIGKVKLLKLVYFYACRAPDRDSCDAAEVVWYAQRYGQIGWRYHQRIGGEWVLKGAPPVTVYVVPGVIKESFGCDEVP